MKITNLDLPEVHIHNIIFGGKEVMIPGRFDELRVRGEYDVMELYLGGASNDFSFSWLLANVELDDAIGNFNATYEIRDGLNIDLIIEEILKGA